jgi:hypothetical protein
MEKWVKCMCNEECSGIKTSFQNDGKLNFDVQMPKVCIIVYLQQYKNSVF